MRRSAAEAALQPKPRDFAPWARLKNVKDKVTGKTKQVVAEINGDFNLKQEGEAQAEKAARRAQIEEKDTFFGKLNDLT
jgi:uncharacterized protein YjbJ (UPF0337 family)